MPPPERRTRWQRLWSATSKFLVDQFLLVSYLVAITIALAWPAPGKAVGSVTVANNVRLVQSINIIIVFFITGLVLNTADVKVALKQPLGLLWGFLSILGVTPLLGFAFKEIPLTPTEFSAGLALFCIAPTTLGVGISLVRSCKGNEALSLLLTVGTNVLAIFIMPLWLKAFFTGDSSLSLHINMGSMLVKLLVTVLAPSLAGKLLRDLFQPVETFAKRHRTGLGLFSTANLACIVWIVLSGARGVLLEQRFVDILYVILLAIGQHLFYLAFNFVVVWYMLCMPPPEAIGAGIMASQKSSPVAVTVISFITPVASEQGLMSIPPLVGQIFQVFMGSALVPFLARWVVRWQQQEAAAAAASPLPALAAPGDTDGVAAGGEEGTDDKDSASIELAEQGASAQGEAPAASKSVDSQPA